MSDHQSGVHAGVFGQERRQPVRAGAVEHAIGSPFSDCTHLGCGDRQEVAGEPDRRAVEMSTRLDPAVRHHAGVVDRGHQLDVGNRVGERDGVASGSVHLWRAPQRIRILHTRVIRPMAGDDGAAVEQPAQVGCRHRLAAVGTQRHEVGGEGAIGCHQRLDAHRRCDVGGAHQHIEIGERHHQHAEHAVGAVDQCKTFLGLQRDGGDARGDHRFGAIALADQGQADVSERGEVATGAERAMFVNGRDDVGVEQSQDRVDDHVTDTAEPHCQCAGAQQHHRPHNFRLDQRAHAGSVRSDERALQLLTSLRRDHGGGEGPEAGRDPIDGFVLHGKALDDRRAPGDGFRSGRRKCDPGTAASDRDHLSRADARWTEDNLGDRVFHQTVT